MRACPSGTAPCCGDVWGRLCVQPRTASDRHSRQADVPVIINGYDASWGVVVGDVGLDRPGEMAPIVIYQPPMVSTPDFVPIPTSPGVGKTPGYGRREIDPPADRTLPPPAQTFERSSGDAESAQVPVTPNSPEIAPHRRPCEVDPNWGGRTPRSAPAKAQHRSTGSIRSIGSGCANHSTDRSVTGVRNVVGRPRLLPSASSSRLFK